MKFENFDDYNWHDSTIYSINLEDNLVFEIDYILETRKLNDASMEFYIAPAKLEFSLVENLKIDIETDFLNGLEIFKISRIGNSWQIQTQEGLISFVSSSFKQTFLRDPIWTNSLNLTDEQRNIN